MTSAPTTDQEPCDGTQLTSLQELTCDMACKNKLDATPFEELLRQKKLSGTVAVFSGDYLSLTPGQLQAVCAPVHLSVKPGRFLNAALPQSGKWR